MRQGLRMIAKHWVSAVLFVVYWLVVTGWSVDQLQTGSGKISEFNIFVQIGASTRWRSDRIPGRLDHGRSRVRSGVEHLGFRTPA
jgi:hypothetical protein